MNDQKSACLCWDALFKEGSLFMHALSTCTVPFVLILCCLPEKNVA